MTEPGRFNQEPVGLALSQQGIQPHLHRQAVDTAHASPWDLLYQRPVIGHQRAINADLAKFIDQHGPLFVRIFIGQQVQY